MLQSGKKIRYTKNEIENFRMLSLDLRGVKTQADLKAACTRWADTLAAERPDLLEKILRALDEFTLKRSRPPKGEGLEPPPSDGG